MAAAEGYTTNAKGHVEKNNKIKSGPCLFPFKYKGLLNNTCLDTPKGKSVRQKSIPKMEF